ncbi:hypothetical protein [Actinomyces naeslundii]|uniref:hypothetical protein n=1 Tax=Actinomyces naeslundii TaxID=1655 RepID=UPI003F9FC4C2
MSQNEVGYSAVYQKVEKLLRDWLAETGGQRVDTYYNAIHLTGEVEHWLTMDGQQESVRLPSKVNFAMDDLRPAQADPVRGAWLWSHFWMEASDGVLHQECDWMREPIIGARSRSNKDAAFELDQFPRDPQWVPEWMAVKAAAYHKEAEKRERRRQRDRERRARKKAQEAEAAQGAEEHSGGE